MDKVELTSTQFHDATEKLLDIIDDCVFIIDEKGRFVLYNKANARLDTLAAEAVIGKHITEVYNLNEETSITLQVLSKKKSIKNVYQDYETISGKHVTSISSAHPIFAGNKLVGAVIVTKDMNIFKSMLTEFKSKAEQRSQSVNTEPGYTFDNIIGKSQSLKSSIELAKKAAQTNSSILVYGDTGTGKELLIQSIHNMSQVKGSFVPLNCAAIPENLLEGLLFGTAKGAFTGSLDHIGLFEKASGGTLFLDELDSMNLNLQSKLLRAIEEGKIRRVGESEERKIDTRIVSALSIGPLEAVEAGRLRRDLFYRLGVVIIKLPSLKERKEDISVLAGHFIEKYNTAFGKSVKGIDCETKDLFYTYHWPGNVRELEHVIESAMNVIDADRQIKKKHLSQFFLEQAHNSRLQYAGLDSLQNAARMTASKNSSLKDTLDTVEQEIISNTLKSTHGNVSEAAKKLSLTRQSLDYKLKKHNLK